MWTYQQSTGQLRHDGHLTGTGYSGHGVGKNDPVAQNVSETGPLPRGLYTIAQCHTHPRLGPIAMFLTPNDSNEMFGRSDFYIHGDNAAHDASLGCIIMPHDTRVEVAASDDRQLLVIQ
jgi:type VI secretion system (T6SS) effector TldE1-like protein